MPAEQAKAVVKASPTPKDFPAGFDKWSPEKQQQFRRFKADFDAEVAKTPEKTRLLEKAFDDKVQAADEKAMVRPAPPDFKPAPMPHKFQLTLIPKKGTLKPGEAFWYRLELKNLGQETVSFSEGYSFWKLGNQQNDKWSFHVTPPGGQEREAQFQSYGYDALGPGARGRMNAAQLEEHAFRSSLSAGLHVNLKPGEILVSAPWRLLTYKEWHDSYYRDIEPAPVSGQFRELALSDKKIFSKPGKYRIRAVFQDWMPKPPAEEDIQKAMKDGESRQEAEAGEMRYYKRILKYSLGRFESNTITIEVKP